MLQNKFWGAQNSNLALGAHDLSYDTDHDKKAANKKTTTVLSSA